MCDGAVGAMAFSGGSCLDLKNKNMTAKQKYQIVFEKIRTNTNTDIFMPPIRQFSKIKQLRITFSVRVGSLGEDPAFGMIPIPSFPHV
jgi:hypothetical protein